MEVPLALLQAIAELPEEALHRGLTHLQAAEFLYDTRLFSGAEYPCSIALTQGWRTGVCSRSDGGRYMTHRRGPGSAR